MKKTPKERFWEKVGACFDGECWPWVGSINRHGYGKFRLDGQSMNAHRACWILENGPVPEGYLVCHSCDKRSCVNPDHLWIGTVAENQRDMAEKGRSYHGDRHDKAKIKRRDARWIRKAYAAGMGTRKEIAERFGISPANVGSIVSRRTWAR